MCAPVAQSVSARYLYSSTCQAMPRLWVRASPGAKVLRDLTVQVVDWTTYTGSHPSASQTSIQKSVWCNKIKGWKYNLHSCVYLYGSCRCKLWPSDWTCNKMANIFPCSARPIHWQIFLLQLVVVMYTPEIFTLNHVSESFVHYKIQHCCWMISNLQSLVPELLLIMDKPGRKKSVFESLDQRVGYSTADFTLLPHWIHLIQLII